MIIIYSVATTNDELLKILKLQQENLFKNISEEEKLAEGFVTVEHTFDLLKEMNGIFPHIIAKSETGEIAGYALCMHPKFGDKIEVLKPMFTILNSIIPKDEKYIVMGQICVSKNYRRKGVFKGLYNAMKKHVASEFDLIITEVDAKNSRSLQAHFSVGFVELSSYHSGGQDWKVISLKA